MQLAYCLGAEPEFIYFEEPLSDSSPTASFPVEDGIWSRAMRGILDFCKFICTDAVTSILYLHARGCWLCLHQTGLDPIVCNNGEQFGRPTFVLKQQK
tara:strand:- start:242 stop:535 length:294 start_codon:yes stop_codon:yes gene_type:complete